MYVQVTRDKYNIKFAEISTLHSIIIVFLKENITF